MLGHQFLTLPTGQILLRGTNTEEDLWLSHNDPSLSAFSTPQLARLLYSTPFPSELLGLIWKRCKRHDGHFWRLTDALPYKLGWRLNGMKRKTGPRQWYYPEGSKGIPLHGQLFNLLVTYSNNMWCNTFVGCPWCRDIEPDVSGCRECYATGKLPLVSGLLGLSRKLEISP